MTDLPDLLADCDARGIRLLASDDDTLTIDAPKDALTPDLLDRLKGRKAAVLALLRPMRDAIPAAPQAAEIDQAAPTRPVCRCGSTTWRDVPIHGGQSVRRDCDRCGLFIDFPVWYEKNTRRKV
jgi:hypothetical protein